MTKNSSDTDNSTAFLSIGGLSRLSGIAVDTLRTWERRYGFTAPIRLASGHRRYASDTVHRLRLARRATEIGFKASFAVMAPMEELKSAIREAEAKEADNIPTPEPSAYDREIASWLSSAENLDSTGFEVALRKTWCRYGARDFIVKLAVPFLERVGELWFDETISVAHEHFISEQLSSFFAGQWRPISKQAAIGKAVAACLEGDHHHLGIHMASVFLALNDFEVIFLGPSTPLDDIVLATREPGVVIAVIGLARTTDLQRAEKTLDALRSAVPASITIAVGGNDDIRRTKGITYVESLDAFADLARTLSDIYNGTR